VKYLSLGALIDAKRADINFVSLAVGVIEIADFLFGDRDPAGGREARIVLGQPHVDQKADDRAKHEC
jgi:hypothetical protein